MSSSKSTDGLSNVQEYMQWYKKGYADCGVAGDDTPDIQEQKEITGAVPTTRPNVSDAPIAKDPAIMFVDNRKEISSHILAYLNSYDCPELCEIIDITQLSDAEKPAWVQGVPTLMLPDGAVHTGKASIQQLRVFVEKMVGADAVNNNGVVTDYDGRRVVIMQPAHLRGHPGVSLRNGPVMRLAEDGYDDDEPAVSTSEDNSLEGLLPLNPGANLGQEDSKGFPAGNADSFQEQMAQRQKFYTNNA